MAVGILQQAVGEILRYSVAVLLLMFPLLVGEVY